MDVFQEAEMLRKVPFFGGLDPAKLKLLAFTSRALRFASGENLMRAGELADSAYVILEGEVEILGKTNAGEFVVAVQGCHALIGEMGVIMNAPRTLTVRAKDAVRALRISDEVFLRLLTENPDCALHVMRVLSTRLASGTREIESLKGQLQKTQAVPGGGTTT